MFCKGLSKKMGIAFLYCQCYNNDVNKRIGGNMKAIEVGSGVSLRWSARKNWKDAPKKGVVTEVYTEYTGSDPFLDALEDMLFGCAIQEEMSPYRKACHYVTYANDKGETEMVPIGCLKRTDGVLKRMDAGKILKSRTFKLGDNVCLTARASRIFEAYNRGEVEKIEDVRGKALVTFKEDGRSKTFHSVWLEKEGSSK